MDQPYAFGYRTFRHRGRDRALFCLLGRLRAGYLSRQKQRLRLYQ
jgi:hypothetical protein